MKILALLALALSSFAADTTPPTQLERVSYNRWLKVIGAERCAFDQKLFRWYEDQRKLPLPNEVAADPEKLFVSVERPLAATIELENAGDIEKGITYGLETYGLVDADIKTTLEAVLFRWGKPVGAASGVTYPSDTLYSFREEKLEPMWGPGAFRTVTHKTGGGVAKDMNDLYTLLVLGNEREGYTLIGSFLGVDGKLVTQTVGGLTLIMLKPTADGKTDYRVAGYHLGQSYAFFGIEFGRRNYGFNRDRIREGQKEFYGQVAELKSTGKITERKPKK